MDDTRCRQFFLEPVELYHRRYEALRTLSTRGLPVSVRGSGEKNIN